jgi:hypothetical protein
MFFDFYIGILERPAGPIMIFHKIIWIAEKPARADTAAMGAINRPLRMVEIFGKARFNGKEESLTG